MDYKNPISFANKIAARVVIIVDAALSARYISGHFNSSSIIVLSGFGDLRISSFAWHYCAAKHTPLNYEVSATPYSKRNSSYIVNPLL
jgi:hypothetical protein